MLGGAIVFSRVGPAGLVRVFEAAAVYFGSGIAAGAVLGLLRPLGVSRVRCVAIGVLAALPIGLTIGALFTVVEGQRLNWFGVLGVALLCGSYIGTSWWQSVAPSV